MGSRKGTSQPAEVAASQATWGPASGFSLLVRSVGSLPAEHAGWAVLWSAAGHAACSLVSRCGPVGIRGENWDVWMHPKEKQQSSDVAESHTGARPRRRPVRPRDPKPAKQYALGVKLRDLALVLGVTLASSTHALAEGKGNAWSRTTTPAEGESAPIGQYTSGCLQGAAELPLDGSGFQVMHPSRRRYFGHPDLVSFVQRLAGALREAKFADLMVGDLSQPRGGPAPGGHSSHQTGLDVDLWYWSPDAAENRALTTEERESTHARSVLDGKTSSIRDRFSSRVLTLLRLAAEDAHVERIFVHPIIKRDACKGATGDRKWLRKLRPWYGHDDHFHVRLSCPDGAQDCIAQTPTPRGDGCGDLDWWFSDEARGDRKKGRATYQAKVGKAPGMPAQCKELLDQPARTAAAPKPPSHSGSDASDKPTSAASDEAPPLRAASVGASL